jgi:hypothetical protein
LKELEEKILSAETERKAQVEVCVRLKSCIVFIRCFRIQELVSKNQQALLSMPTGPEGDSLLKQHIIELTCTLEETRMKHRYNFK